MTVDTVTFIVCGGVGLDICGEPIPDIAGWGENGAPNAVTELVGVIDNPRAQASPASLPETACGPQPRRHRVGLGARGRR